MKLVIIALALAAILVSIGCAHTVMRDPKTGAAVDCNLVGAQMSPGNPVGSGIEAALCKQTYQNLGYACVSGC